MLLTLLSFKVKVDLTAVAPGTLLTAMVVGGALAVLFMLVNLVWFAPRKLLAHFEKQGVPSHPFRPVLGQLPEIISAARSDDVWKESRDSIDKLGRVFTSCFGPLPRLVIAEPEMAHQVLAKCSGHYHKTTAGKRILGPILGEGLFFSEDALWRHQRSLINPAFHHIKIKDMVPLMVRAANRFVGKWDGVVDVHREMSALTLDIIASAALGSGFQDSPQVTDAVYNTFTDVLHEIQARNLSVIGLLPLLNKLPTPGYRRIQKGVQEIQTLVMSVVNARRRGESHSLCEGQDLLDLILEARDPDTGEAMSEEQVKDEAMTFMLAGHETTAILLTWALAVLADPDKGGPEMWDRCEKEINGVLKPGEVANMDVLKHLTYMDAFLSECMRYYPPVPYIRREAIDDHQLVAESTKLTLNVPKDTMVSINCYMIHHHPVYWPKPEQFKPERFLDGEKHVPGSYLSFGAGPRRCIGRVFALLEAKAILVAIIRKFARVRLVPGQVIVPELSLTMRPKYGVMLSVESRV